MASYGSMDKRRVGTLNGLDGNLIESKIANVEIDFGKGVFYKVGDEDKAYLADSLDATLVFAGVASISQRSYGSTVGSYIAGDQVNVLREGEIWVQCTANNASIAGKPVYLANVVATTATYGKFTDASAGAYATGAYFKTNSDANGLALIEVRGLK